MSSDPSLTFNAALKILGAHDGPARKISTMLGIASVAAGGAGAIAYVSGATLSASVVLNSIWGWVDQKNELTELLQRAIDEVTVRTSPMASWDRRELIKAAHTCIAVSALFDAVEARLGTKTYRALKISKAERARLVAGGRPSSDSSDLFDAIYLQSVPAPSADGGFIRNCIEVHQWAGALAPRLTRFFSGLASWEVSRQNAASLSKLGDETMRRYYANYLRLAAKVPEFAVWASFTEHSVTHSGIRELREHISELHMKNDVALSSLSQLLSLVPEVGVADRDPVDMLALVNNAELRASIIPDTHQNSQIRPPSLTLEATYVPQGYRITSNNKDSRPADEGWWSKQVSRTDIVAMLATHVTCAEGTKSPLLLLGHPGAGKSMLSKIIAARLPSSTFAAVRVPLRSVNANAPVYTQIQQALDLATHERVRWTDLSDKAPQLTRVVIFDGLDELLQATTDSKSGYLQEIGQFQRRESDLGRPVAVIVTSRTLVADRVEIPFGVPIVKLDDFTEQEIRSWADKWRRITRPEVDEGRMREVIQDDLVRYSQLAKQPLLLLMIALYLSDPSTPPLEENISTSRLYRQLLDAFLRREIRKDHQAEGLTQVALSDKVNQRLNDLAIAAFAMFNRGRQSVRDIDLAADVGAFTAYKVGTDVARPEDIAFRIVGRFFFVHAAEARLGLNSTHQRSYEFLHATFGEFLIANYVVELLRHMDRSSAQGVGEFYDSPNDDRLYALLSHQSLALRGNICALANEIMDGLFESDRRAIVILLQRLIAGIGARQSSTRFATYSPTPHDAVRNLAVYSSNLFVLRLTLPNAAEQNVNLWEVWQAPDHPRRAWCSLVRLWQSGLDEPAFAAVVSGLRRDVDRIVSASARSIDARMLDSHVLFLLYDYHGAARNRIGHAVTTGAVAFQAPDFLDWDDQTLAVLLALLMHPGTLTGEIPYDPPASLDVLEASKMERLVSILLKASQSLPRRTIDYLLKLQEFTVANGAYADGVAFAIATAMAADGDDLWGHAWQQVSTIQRALDSDASFRYVSRVMEAAIEVIRRGDEAFANELGPDFRSESFRTVAKIVESLSLDTPAHGSFISRDFGAPDEPQ